MKSFSGNERGLELPRYQTCQGLKQKTSGFWNFPPFIPLGIILIISIYLLTWNFCRIKSWQSGYQGISVEFRDILVTRIFSHIRQACFNHGIIQAGMCSRNFCSHIPNSELGVRSKLKLCSKRGFFPFRTSKEFHLWMNQLMGLPTCW